MELLPSFSLFPSFPTGDSSKELSPTLIKSLDEEQLTELFYYLILNFEKLKNKKLVEHCLKLILDEQRFLRYNSPMMLLAELKGINIERGVYVGKSKNDN